ncbi:hypothetical protein [Aquitalea magnusonii]|uniref:Uncharacterized protein n=1 Tax=Aquitalea magnusonii TaxID=332411 RepID=A0A318JZ56_9NEIS|nr:hypothetical protein [Aquitalea magnusonii]PXX51054.1 hypothetical protein DFR38_101113 [Aquitalea magnusonii]
MNKLFKLKKFLTLEDAAKRLTASLGEDVDIKDVLQLAIDGHLKLSVDFVNHTQAIPCNRVPIADAKFSLFMNPSIKGEMLEIFNKEFPKTAEYTSDELLNESKNWIDHLSQQLLDILKEYPLTAIYKGPRNETEVFELEDHIVTLKGCYTLPMIGAERLDIRHEFQLKTGGPSITLTSIDGAFVEDENGKIYQLQESFDDNQYQKGSLAAGKELERQIKQKKIKEDEAKKIRDEHTKNRKEYLKKAASQPEKNNYYPSSGLPSDSVLMVKASDISKFEASLEDNGDSGNSSDLPSDTTLKMLAGLALVLAEKGGRYKRGENPNYSQISQEIEVVCKNLPNADTFGLSPENIRKYISQGLALLGNT